MDYDKQSTIVMMEVKEFMENKPIILEIQDVRIGLINIINNAVQKKGVPCYFLEPIIADLYRQVQAQAKVELEQVQISYSAQNNEEPNNK